MMKEKIGGNKIMEIIVRIKSVICKKDRCHLIFTGEIPYYTNNSIMFEYTGAGLNCDNSMIRDDTYLMEKIRERLKETFGSVYFDAREVRDILKDGISYVIEK